MSCIPSSYLLEIVTEEQYDEIVKKFRGDKIYIPKKEYEIRELRKLYQEMHKQGVRNEVIMNRLAQISEKHISTIYRMKDKGLFEEEDYYS